VINYKHLHYFWTISKEGSIARASDRLHITPQTISGQLSLLENYLETRLFNRIGRNLELTENGRFILSYADEIFSLGHELEDAIHQFPRERAQLFRVGIVDVVPKSIAHNILKPALHLEEPIRLICREASLDNLLAELSLHHLDLVLADREIPTTISTRSFSHKLGESALSFFACESLLGLLKGDFPDCLTGMPILLPSKGTQLRLGLDQWLDKHRIHPNIVAEFDDSALLKAFGQQGAGIFIAPEVMKEEVKRQYNVTCIGRTDEITENFYAISTERHISHPVTSEVLSNAKEAIFSNKIKRK